MINLKYPDKLLLYVTIIKVGSTSTTLDMLMILSTLLSLSKEFRHFDRFQEKVTCVGRVSMVNKPNA